MGAVVELVEARLGLIQYFYKVNSYIYTLFSIIFVVFVKIRREIIEICRVKMLFINMFGHDVQQSLQWNIMSTNHVTCLFATSQDNASHATIILNYPHWQMRIVAW